MGGGVGREQPGETLTGGGTRANLRTATGALTAALRNRDIRSLELGWTVGTGADWALLVVTLLVAYATGGALLVGLVPVLRMVPATLVNILVDPARLARPERTLVAVNLVRAVAASAAAVGIAQDVPALVFAAAAAASAAGALVRPTTMTLLPAVAVTPEELVAANVTFALGEAAGTFAGPLLAGLVVAGAGPAQAAALVALAAWGAAVISLVVRVADAARPRRGDVAPGLPLVAGLRALGERRDAGAVMASFMVQLAVRGALTACLTALALEVLGLGEGGVGLLGAAMGLGGLLGALVALGLGTSRGLAPLHVGALAAWGAPLVVIGLVATTPVALIALAVVGVANAVLDVAGFTLLQRGIPGRSRSAVFAVLEVGAGAFASLGGIAGSLLLATMGTEVAVAVSGLALPVAAALVWPASRRLDRDAVVPGAQAALLRAIPLFRPLPLGAIEQLAGGMRHATFAPGEPLMTEGEAGDEYVILDSGRVMVSAGGRALGEEGPGAGLGEIALLRAGPRTATVTALEPVAAWIIDCPTFLAAVTGHGGSSAAATQVVEERLGRGGVDGAGPAAGPGAGA